MLDEAISVWRQSNYNTQLQPLIDDPVMKLIMSAIAYQTNEMDDDIERIKDDVLKAYADLLTPYHVGHATPATAVVRTMPIQGIGVTDIDAKSQFKLDGTEFGFLPILHTRIFPVSVQSFVRLDGRRWEVNVSFDSPVSDLSYMSFAIMNPSFRDVHVYVGDKRVPLIRPWEYSELPFSDIFAFSNDNNEASAVYNPSMTLIDLFARHGLRVFFVRATERDQFIQEEALSLKFVFEFDGVPADFIFNESQLIFNPVILANVALNEVSLDSGHPISRITGDAQDPYSQLVHVLQPDDEQIYGEASVYVRKISADRFNQASLYRMVSSLIGKLHSDYYAFSEFDGNEAEEIIAEMELLLHKLAGLIEKSPNSNVPGTYLLLDNPWKNKGLSVSLHYVTTAGAAVNGYLNEKSRFQTPAVLDTELTSQIVPPEFGADENDMRNGQMSTEQIRYFVQTSNRIITVNDIRVFCYKELSARYGIMPNMIREIKVKPHLCEGWASSGNACGYEISVRIDIVASPYVKRTFADKVTQAEILLEKMMQVRSVNIYPISVKINVK